MNLGPRFVVGLESINFVRRRRRVGHLSDKMADKLRTTQQLEALQNKYVGTGHADTTRFEWTSNIARDSLASYVGHPPLLSYMTLAMGEGTREEMRMKLIEKMVRPVGPPPEVNFASAPFQFNWSLTLSQTRDQE